MKRFLLSALVLISTVLTLAGSSNAFVGVGTSPVISSTSGVASLVERVDLIAIIGQSNADGRETIANLLSSVSTFYDTRRDSLNIYYKPAVRTGASVTAGSLADDGAWWTLDDGHDAGNTLTHQVIGFAGSTVATQTAALFGPELSLGYDYHQYYGDDREVYILKAAVGNAGINNQWDAEGGGGLWNFFKTYVYDPAVADIEADGKKVGRIFVFWMQGQADAANSTLANDYENQLNFLYDRINDELTDGTSVTIIDIGIPDVTASGSNGQIIEAAKETVASERSNVYYFPADGSGFYPEYGVRSGDTTHFSAQGYEDMMDDAFAWFISQTVPFNLTAPVASGTAEIGQTLSCTDGTWLRGTSFTYQWELDGVDISGATSNSFTVANYGNHTCDVTPTEAGAYTATSNAINVIAPTFDPTSDPAVDVWMIANDENTIVATGSSLSEWTDLANANDFEGNSNPSTGTRTRNSVNVLDFDGTDDCLRLYDSGANNRNTIGTTDFFAEAAQDFTIIVAGEADTSGTFASKATGTAADRTLQIAVDSDPDLVFTLRGGQTEMIAGYTANTPVIMVITWDGSSTTARGTVNGGSWTTLTVGTAANNSNELNLGARTNCGGFRLNGAIYAFGAGDSVWSDSLINNTAGLIADTYGFTWTDL